MERMKSAIYPSIVSPTRDRPSKTSPFFVDLRFFLFFASHCCLLSCVTCCLNLSLSIPQFSFESSAFLVTTSLIHPSLFRSLARVLVEIPPFHSWTPPVKPAILIICINTLDNEASAPLSINPSPLSRYLDSCQQPHTRTSGCNRTIKCIIQSLKPKRYPAR